LRASTIGISIVFLIFSSAAGAVAADTQLFVPSFSTGAAEDAQLLLLNGNDADSPVQLWAFTSRGELLGQLQLTLKARSTRTLTLADAFNLRGAEMTGWLSAISRDQNIQLSYVQLVNGLASEPIEALKLDSNENLLSVADPSRQSVRIANPNAFPADVNFEGVDASGGFLKTQSLRVAAFSQIDVPIGQALGGSTAQLRVHANAHVISTIDQSAERAASQAAQAGAALADDFALTINTEEALGAYHVTLRYDPQAVEFSAAGITGGTADGFDSKPLVINIDNAAGIMTIASFQVGENPRGNVRVARINALRKTGAGLRFQLQPNEIADVEGNSLNGSGVSVGLVRAR
jgi:hypothetical protein